MTQKTPPFTNFNKYVDLLPSWFSTIVPNQAQNQKEKKKTLAQFLHEKKRTMGRDDTLTELPM